MAAVGETRHQKRFRGNVIRGPLQQKPLIDCCMRSFESVLDTGDFLLYTEDEMTRMQAEKSQWSLAELAEEVGLSARTVRFYIGRGLLPGPEKAGRGARYGSAHLERLREIQRLQASGLTLAEIAARGEVPEALRLPEPEPWWSYEVADGVEVRVRADQAPWRLRQIRRALAELGRHLESSEDETHSQGGTQ